MPSGCSWDKDVSVRQQLSFFFFLVRVAPSAMAQSFSFSVYLGGGASTGGVRAMVKEGALSVFIGHCFSCLMC